MPVRKPVFIPPFNVVRASHVELTVRDLARSRAFYVDCLGYLVSAEEPGALYLRAVEERNHHSIVLREGKAPAAHALGFKLASEEDLDRAADWFKRRNLPTAFPEVPYQGRTLRTADVTGMPLEFYFKMDQGERMLQRYAAYQGARIQRIDTYTNLANGLTITSDERTGEQGPSRHRQRRRHAHHPHPGHRQLHAVRGGRARHRPQSGPGPHSSCSSITAAPPTTRATTWNSITLVKESTGRSDDACEAAVPALT